MVVRRAALGGDRVQTTAPRQSLGHLAHAHGTDAGSRQAQRQRQAIELMADPRHCSGHGGSQGKPGVRRCGPVDEQPRRVRAHHRPDPTPWLRQTERPESKHVLARDPQRLSARNQRPQSGSAVEELSHDTPDLCRQMLAVVEHEQ